MRGPNAIDFWRGYALACIYIDHLPHNIFDRLTMQNFAVSNAAELFVFLAGWSLSLATGGPTQSEAPSRILFRICSRMADIYVAQIAISAIALAILAAAALGFGDDRFLNLLNAGPVFEQPVRYTLGWVTLAYQLRYFDILPLYIVLLACAAPIVLIARKQLAVAVGLSFLLYAICRAKAGGDSIPCAGSSFSPWALPAARSQPLMGGGRCGLGCYGLPCQLWGQEPSVH